MKRKLVSFDWAIKKILRSKANFDVLEGFLSELLFEDITILEILDTESNKDTRFNKSNRVDIKVRNSKDEIILVEVQYSSELDYLQKISYSSSKAITEHIGEGSSFSDVSKIISVNILYFDFGTGSDYIYKGTTNFVGIHNKTKLELDEAQKKLYPVEKVEQLFPEYYLIKVKNFDDVAKTPLDEWINFLKNEEIADNTKAKGLEKAKSTLDILKLEEDEKISYDKYQYDLHHQASIYESTYVLGMLDGREEGIEQGIEQERQKNREEKLNIAKSLLDILDDETISLKLDLDIKIIRKLKDEL